ncbi:trichohyalin-like [Polyodon spathula]|uniref:trichohyalin-like n=1 Tax=Polyodon spathula TaxID=7913 RepID=UPI001B7F1C81|nr:trichohyalin-like [Polyodon spathula]
MADMQKVVQKPSNALQSVQQDLAESKTKYRIVKQEKDILAEREDTIKEELRRSRTTVKTLSEVQAQTNILEAEKQQDQKELKAVKMEKTMLQRMIANEQSLKQPLETSVVAKEVVSITNESKVTNGKKLAGKSSVKGDKQAQKRDQSEELQPTATSSEEPEAEVKTAEAKEESTGEAEAKGSKKIKEGTEQRPKQPKVKDEAEPKEVTQKTGTQEKAGDSRGKGDLSKLREKEKRKTSLSEEESSPQTKPCPALEEKAKRITSQSAVPVDSRKRESCETISSDRDVNPAVEDKNKVISPEAAGLEEESQFEKEERTSALTKQVIETEEFHKPKEKTKSEMSLEEKEKGKAGGGDLVSKHKKENEEIPLEKEEFWDQKEKKTSEILITNKESEHQLRKEKSLVRKKEKDQIPLKKKEESRGQKGEKEPLVKEECQKQNEKKISETEKDIRARNDTPPENMEEKDKMQPEKEESWERKETSEKKEKQKDQWMETEISPELKEKQKGGVPEHKEKLSDVQSDREETPEPSITDQEPKGDEESKEKYNGCIQSDREETPEPPITDQEPKGDEGSKEKYEGCIQSSVSIEHSEEEEQFRTSPEKTSIAKTKHPAEKGPGREHLEEQSTPGRPASSELAFPTAILVMPSSSQEEVVSYKRTEAKGPVRLRPLPPVTDRHSARRDLLREHPEETLPVSQKVAFISVENPEGRPLPDTKRKQLLPLPQPVPVKTFCDKSVQVNLVRNIMDFESGKGDLLLRAKLLELKLEALEDAVTKDPHKMLKLEALEDAVTKDPHKMARPEYKIDNFNEPLCIMDIIYLSELVVISVIACHPERQQVLKEMQKGRNTADSIL